MRSKTTLPLFALALLVFSSLALADEAASTPDRSTGAAPSAICDTGELELPLPTFTPALDGVVWTSDGCTASLTCHSGCIRHCTGTVSCFVGPDYVECDGNPTAACPTCDLQQYPGYPTCGIRSCPWCTCMSNGGSPSNCCL